MSSFQGLDVADAVGWSRRSEVCPVIMGRQRLGQVVEGNHHLLLLQDVPQAGLGQGPARDVHVCRGRGGGGWVGEALSLGDLGTIGEVRTKA